MESAARPWTAVCRLVVKEMKSNKQRRKEIKAKRKKRAELKAVGPVRVVSYRPLYSVEANQNELLHNNTYGLLPTYYVDKPFKCCDCGKNEIWTAISQKWWYEVAKGHIDSIAVRCKTCRKKLRLEKEQQKQHMNLMAQRKPHPNETFFKKRY